MKLCNTCEIEKPLEEFSKRGENGYQSKCKSCDKEYRLQHKDEASEYAKEYYYNNKERLLNGINAYYIENRNKILKYAMEYQKNYRETETGRLNCNRANHIRRANLKNIKEVFTMKEWLIMIDATNGVCPKCKTFVGKTKMTLDHIIPISKVEEGHIYTINNVQPMCRSCNSSKGGKL